MMHVQSLNRINIKRLKFSVFVSPLPVVSGVWLNYRLQLLFISEVIAIIQTICSDTLSQLITTIKSNCRVGNLGQAIKSATALALEAISYFNISLQKFCYLHV